MANSKKNPDGTTNETPEIIESETALSTDIIAEIDITASFANLNVSELNKAIEGIASRQTKMSDDEKKYALEIVNSWNTDIIQSIHNEHNKLSEFMNNVKDVTRSYKTLMSNPDFMEPMQNLINIAGLQDKAAEIGEAIATTEDAAREYDTIRKMPLDIDETIATKMEELEARHQHSKEVLIAQNAYNKATRTMNRLISEFNRALNSNADVKAALSTLAAFDRKLVRSEQTCKTKANQAKLAIAIDDADLRAKLNDLINIHIGR